SVDIASGAQNSSNFGGAFVENPFNLNENRGNSSFDIRHIVNANYLYDLPFGRGRHFLAGSHGVVQQIVGGWETTGIFRWNSGLPSGQPADASQWATNFNAQSNGVAIRPLEATPTRTG